jgi:hypothetical protein
MPLVGIGIHADVFTAVMSWCEGVSIHDHLDTIDIEKLNHLKG